MKNISKRTRISVLLLGIALIAIIAYFFQAKIVLLAYNVMYKDKVQHALDVANKEIDYPFTLLGVKDNKGPAYKAPASCYHNEPPGVFVESVGCLASINASRNAIGNAAVAGLQPKFDMWVDSLGKHLDEHEWRAIRFDNESGNTRPISNKTVYGLQESGYHRITYEKSINGVRCSLSINTDDRPMGAEQEASLFIGGDLSCGRSTEWLL